VDISTLDSNTHAVGTANPIVGAYFSTLASTAAGSPANPIYNLVDLSAQTVTEAVNGFADANGGGNGHGSAALGYVTNVKGFESINNTGNLISGHLLGDGSANTINAGASGDLIYGGAGSSGDGTHPGGDILNAGLGIDQFIYKGEGESPNTNAATQDPALFPDNKSTVEAQDTIGQFTTGQDQLVFNINDSYDSIKVTAGTTASQQVLFAGGAAGADLTVDISKNAGATDVWAKQDNYQIHNAGPGAINATDVVLNVQASDGADKIDASAGGGIVSAVDVVYTAASQSQGGTSDSIYHFVVGGQDKIDLSQLKDSTGLYLTQQQDIYQGATNTANAGVLDGADALASIIHIGTAIAPNADAANLFVDNVGGTKINRAIAVEQWNVQGNANSTLVFVDVNHDGNYTQGADMAIGLVGIPATGAGSVQITDFIFNHHA